MILYSFYHGMHLPLIISDRLVRHKNEKAVLLVSNSHAHFGGKFKNLYDFKIEGVFDDIIVFDGSYGKNAKTIEEEETKNINELDMSFKISGYDLNHFSKIYVFTDHINPVGLYLIMKGIYYYHCEDIANTFAGRRSIESAYNNLYSHSPIHQDTLKKHGGWGGFNKHVTPILHPESINPFKNIKHFEINNFYDSIIKVEKNWQQKILNIFKYDMNKHIKINTLYLMHGGSALNVAASANPKILKYSMNNDSSWKDPYNYFHQIVIDYFLSREQKNTLILKSHPGMSILQNELLEIFNSVEIIPYGLPSEFMKWIDNLEIETIFSTATTSITTFGKPVKNNLSTGGNAYYSFYYFHRLYAALLLVNNQFYEEIIMYKGFDGAGDSNHWGNIIDKFIENVIQNTNEKKLYIKANDTTLFDITKSKITVIRRPQDIHDLLLMEKYILNEGVIVLIDSDEELKNNMNFIEIIGKYMYPIKIEKKKIKEKILCKTDDEFVYVFCSEKTAEENNIINFWFNKILSFVGIKIRTKPYKTKEEIEKYRLFFMLIIIKNYLISKA
ncbi:MAG: hypothetical protein FWE90_06915 [Defluviitaleaceae bacterium]|nr:hypothetical protein [Defluviitaleaceae bacterium]